MLDATERVRARLGADLHDGLCQHLAGTAFFARALAARAQDDSPAARESIVKLAELIDEAVEQARAAAIGLVPPALRDRPLADLLEDLVQRMSSGATPPFVSTSIESFGRPSIRHCSSTELRKRACPTLSDTPPRATSL
ncbi:MAG: hypothetical protein HC923_03075 [Myxococcales bacterium]|nr:hypothetical protein [Myxococcales bacterium]